MRLGKSYIILLFCLISGVIFAQIDKPRSKTKRSQNTSRISKKAKILCPVFGSGNYPFQGLGIKLGDPFAITYKYYISENFGFVLDFGKASSGLYNRYFRERFPEYVQRDTIQNGGAIDYLTHQVKVDWVGEIKLLWHLDAKKISPGLKVYFGIGPEIKSTQLLYQYLYTSDETGTITRLGSFKKRRMTFGPQLTLGIEYAYFQIPLSAFMEVELFNDLTLDPGWRRFEGGIGLRYIF